VERRLAAILVADVVGYARMIEADEAGTLAALKARRRAVLDPLLAKHRGRLVKLMGDGALVEFASAVNAVLCAIELQEEMDKANSGLAQDKAIVLRIGVNLGDVVVEGSDLYGDGVNIAARLEAMAEPGGICLSGSIHDQVKGKMAMAFQDLGHQVVKNIAEPVQVFRLSPSVGFKHSSQGHESLPLPAKPSIAVLPFANMSDDPAQDYFADGVVEEITAALSRVRSLFVIARNSAFVYRARPATPQQIGRELGVRYLIEGSVRKAGRARANHGAAR
jgi:adenylate cyclase